MSACGDGTYADSISANAVPSGNTLTLPISCKFDPGSYHHYGGSCFTSNQRFVDMIDTVQDICGTEHVSTHSYQSAANRTGSSILIRMNHMDGTTDYYLLSMIGPDQTFIFYGMGANIISLAPDLYGVNKTGATQILLPFHFISDDRIFGAINPELYAGTEYQLLEPPRELQMDPFDGESLIRWNILQFKEFYQRSGRYQVAQAGNTLTIQADDKTFELSFVHHVTQTFFSVQEKTA